MTHFYARCICVGTSASLVCFASLYSGVSYMRTFFLLYCSVLALHCMLAVQVDTSFDLGYGSFHIHSLRTWNAVWIFLGGDGRCEAKNVFFFPSVTVKPI